MPSRPVALELETNLYIRFGSDGVLPQPQAQAFTWSVFELYPRDNALLIGWNVLFIPSHRIKAVADKLQGPLSAVAARLKRREVASEGPAGTDPGKGFRWPEDVRTRLTD